MNKNKRFVTPLLLALFAVSLGAAALESDSKDPVYIDANSATYDEKKGEAIYIGNVQAVQGTMTVNSDQMNVLLQGGKVNKIIAVGNPVRIKQTQKVAASTINSTSQKAEYYPNEYRLVLIGKAVVVQGGNTYTSDLIEYDTRNAIVTAGQKSSGSKRVHVKIGGAGE
ncbi:MAG TPA: lipopolysaccharide transport periplasmic protein LptA [Methylococcaceae bacterium]|nr:lipopolysaccharide transport periplasmic protein LptA [Methylococcaceae bacterium]